MAVYKSNIRNQYYNISTHVENGELRQLLNNFINLKNQFAKYDFKLNKVENRFVPEVDNYYQGLAFVSIPFIYMSIIVALVLIIILISRAACKNWKKRRSYYIYRPSNYKNYVISLGLLLFLLLASVVVVYIGIFEYYLSQKEATQ